MSEIEDGKVTLFHWNILEVNEDNAIFVGLFLKPDSVRTVFPFNCGFRSSSAIKNFDPITGIGITKSGRCYQCVGEPSDPHGIIRSIVAWHFGSLNAKYRYNFADVDP